MARLDHLHRDQEYLLWYEPHRRRWIAAPLHREGPLILDTDYRGGISLRLREE